MILAWSYLSVSAMSWSLEILPTPMAPMLILLLGASLPITWAGTMVGNPSEAIPVATPVLTVDFMKSLLLNPLFSAIAYFLISSSLLVA